MEVSSNTKTEIHQSERFRHDLSLSREVHSAVVGIFQCQSPEKYTSGHELSEI